MDDLRKPEVGIVAESLKNTLQQPSNFSHIHWLIFIVNESTEGLLAPSANISSKLFSTTFLMWREFKFKTGILE